jgi:hypothetical protein
VALSSLPSPPYSSFRIVPVIVLFIEPTVYSTVAYSIKKLFRPRAPVLAAAPHAPPYVHSSPTPTPPSQLTIKNTQGQSSTTQEGQQHNDNKTKRGRQANVRTVINFCVCIRLSHHSHYLSLLTLSPKNKVKCHKRHTKDNKTEKTQRQCRAKVRTVTTVCVNACLSLAVSHSRSWSLSISSNTFADCCFVFHCGGSHHCSWYFHSSPSISPSMSKFSPFPAIPYYY